MISMWDGGKKLGMLSGIIAAVFGVTAIVLLKLMPAPRRDVDYMVAGCIATLVALLVVFALLLGTSQRSGGAFFTKRRIDD